MAEEVEKQDGQKTIVAFIAGLLIGGLLVWVFATPANDRMVEDGAIEDDTATTADDDADVGDNQAGESDDTDDAATDTDRQMQTGEGEVEVNDQPAGMSVDIEGAVFPRDDGWIAVRTYENGQLGNILGAARFSKSQGLIPDQIALLAPTMAGRTYAIVFFTEDGDRNFNLANDVQVDGVFETFQAQ